MTNTNELTGRVIPWRPGTAVARAERSPGTLRVLIGFWDGLRRS